MYYTHTHIYNIIEIYTWYYVVLYYIVLFYIMLYYVALYHIT